MKPSPGKLWGMRRLADQNGLFKMVAADQRPPIKNYIRSQREVSEAPYEDVAAVKSILVRELGAYCTAMLLDPHVALPQNLNVVDPGKGLIATLEDSVFEETSAGRLSSAIDHWSVEKIKRLGADAVKVLAWYRPDAAPDVCERQKEFVRKIGDECKRYDIPFVFELLVYPLSNDSYQTRDYVEHKDKHPDLVLQSVETFSAAEYGVDIFKLESPVSADRLVNPGSDKRAEVERTQNLFNELGRLAARPWVMLSAGAGMAEFRHVLSYAYNAGASGFLAGRAIWWSAFLNFPDLGAMTDELQKSGVPYLKEIEEMTNSHATPWSKHPSVRAAFEGAYAAADFRSRYKGFG